VPFATAGILYFVEIFPVFRLQAS